MEGATHDDATLPRRTYDLADAQRVFSNVSAELFGVQAQPSRIGRFILIEKIGSGGMGVVYSAFDPELQRKVAVKLLHEREGSAPNGSSLLREARALARLQHRNIAAIYDVGAIDDGVFIAMEYVDGTTLREWTRAGRSVREIIDAFQQVAEALSHAHSQGLIHRDVKPANLVIEAGGRTVVLDFGLARFGREDSGEQTLPSGPGPVTQAERTFGLAGTPAYMSPEQLRGETATAASDQFSFCVSLYETLTGTRPFRAASPMALYSAIQAQSFEPLPGTTPRWLVQLISRGLRAEPSERWPNLEALGQELRRHRRPWYRRLALPLAATAITLTTAVLAGGPFDDPCDNAAQEVAQVWNPDTRTRVDEALQGRAVDDTRNYALEEIDGFAASLATARRGSCEREESAAVRAERACLTRELSRLRAIVTLLREPDRDIAANLMRITPHADAIGECLLPVSAETEWVPAEARAELEEALARAAALVDAGRTEAAIELASSNVVAARVTADAAVLARAELGLGRALIASGNPSKAVETLDRALLHAEASEDPATRLSAMLELAGALIKTSKYDEAERLLSLAAAGQSRFESHPVSWDFQLEDTAAELATARRDFGEALEHYRRAEKAATGLGGNLAQRLSVQSSLSGALFRLQRFDEALAVSVALREERLRLYGPDDLGLAVVDSLIGVISMANHDDATAQTALRRAVGLRERVQGANHPALSAVLTNLGLALLATDPAGAASFLERALAGSERAHGPASAQAAKAHYALGRAYRRSDRTEDALRAFRTSAEILESIAEPGDPELLLSRVRAGQTEEALGRCDRALRDFDTVIDSAADGADADRDADRNADRDARADALGYARQGRVRCLAAAADHE